MRKIPTLIVAAFLLSFVWENAQAPLYAGYVNVWQHMPFCTIAAVTDVLLIAALYTVYLRMRKNIPVLIIAGAVVGIGVELLALSLGWWQYAARMPLLPILRIGVVPVLLTVILPPIIFRLADRARTTSYA